MRSFRDIPIKQKLMVITMVTTTVALVLAAIGIVAFDAFLFRQSLTRDLSALSRIIADNSTAALAFNDPRAATETLAALRARPHLATACIYRADGSLLAKYARQDGVSLCPPPTAQDEFRFSNTDLTVSHAIFLSGRRIGTLLMLYDLDEIFERMKLYGTTVLGVLLVSSLIAFLLSSSLRAAIATPISHLVRATTSVAQTSDYSVRAQKVSGDELGVLVDRFNEMLAGIQSRDNNLIDGPSRPRRSAPGRREARERFRFMAESMPQKIFTTTPAGETNYFNRQWMEFTGLPVRTAPELGLDPSHSSRRSRFEFRALARIPSKPASRFSCSTAVVAPMAYTNGT